MQQQETLAPEQERTAIQSPEQLKRFLKASDRQFIIFAANDLVDSLPFPQGVQLFQSMVEFYRHQRWTIETGRIRIEKDEMGNDCEVPIYKADALEVEELEMLRAWVDKELAKQRG